MDAPSLLHVAPLARRAQAMDLSAAEEEARAAGQAEPRRVTDPRLVQDRQGCLAFAIAMQVRASRARPSSYCLRATGLL